MSSLFINILKPPGFLLYPFASVMMNEDLVPLHDFHSPFPTFFNRIILAMLIAVSLQAF